MLRQDKRLVVQNKLAKNKIIELALNNDASLIQLLLSCDALKNVFFDSVENVTIFDKVKFQKFISNKQFLPDSYTSYRNRIGLTVNDDFVSESDKVVLAWPYKDCVLKGGQTEEKDNRKEDFLNEILATHEIDVLLDSKVLTNFRRYTKTGSEICDRISSRENLIIEGNNLIVLHCLKRRLANRIKLIYIDPPYNPEGDDNSFTYNNSFNHSTWLTFMKNRLSVAKDLLKNDGFIVIAIDHNELLYLGVLADEIFGRDNRLGLLTVVNNPMGRNQAKYFSTINDFMLVYARNKEHATFNSVILHDKDLKQFDLEDSKGRYQLKNYIRKGGGNTGLAECKPNFWYPIFVDKECKCLSLERNSNLDIEIWPITDAGQKRTWKKIRSSTQQMINDGEFVVQREKDRSGKSVIRIYEKYRIEKGKKVPTVWSDTKYNANHKGKRLLKNLVPDSKFSYPKSRYTVLDVLKIMTSKNDIVLDFFAGSGTTADATLLLNQEDGGNRKFILVEQLSEHVKVCQKRIEAILKSIDTSESLVSCELAQRNHMIIKRIQKATSKEVLWKIFKEIADSEFLSYRIEPEVMKVSISEFDTLPLGEQKRILEYVLDKDQLYVSASEIDDEELEFSEVVKRINRQFYSNSNDY